MITDIEAGDRSVVERQLSAGERVEWIGRPDPGSHFTRGDLYLVPFSILWAGFAVFWEATAIASGAGLFFALWGIPFVLIGLYFVVGRFIYKAYRARRTVYAVTDRRVLSIAARRGGETVETTYLRALPGISTTAGANGRGSVDVGNSGPIGNPWGNNGMEYFTRGSSGKTGVSFCDIDDARGVADLVERLRQADRG